MDEKEIADWAWLAGFADGEGSFYPILEKRIDNRVGFRMGTCFQVCNTNLLLLNKVIEIVGCGTIRCTHKSKGDHEKDCFVVDFSRKEILAVLPRVLPFLVGKKRQAEIILEMCRRMFGKNIRYSQKEWNHIIGLYNEIRSLNKRGQVPFVPIDPSAIRPAQYIVSSRRCSLELCNSKHYGRGLCRQHWRQKFGYKPAHKEQQVLNVITPEPQAQAQTG